LGGIRFIEMKRNSLCAKKKTKGGLWALWGQTERVFFKLRANSFYRAKQGGGEEGKKKATISQQCEPIIRIVFPTSVLNQVTGAKSYRKKRGAADQRKKALARKGMG